MAATAPETAPAPTDAPDRPGPSILDSFHPAVGQWFARQFPGGPTTAQSEAWPVIATGRDVLVASPTGTGKTLTGFLVGIDAAYRAHDRGAVAGLPEVLYVSPLRALAADVHQNLQVPLAGIAQEAARLGLDGPNLRIGVRTGDTSPSERAAMKKSPPDLLVTTPESLYLLLTAAASRAMLRGVRTVIVDEVHTLARDKRGSHLALSLERLAHVVAAEGGRLQRIGLSATQRPLEVVARLLGGVGPGTQMPAIVDCGHRRDLDVAVELPAAELEAVASHGQFAEVLDRIAGHVLEHRTTLIFVNTRKLAERVAHQLAERLEDTADGPGAFLVAAHHGSLSSDRRRLVEARLRAGELRALVATASLELGIDVGPVELVCQIGSPRAISTFLQRVGRANHQLEGTPMGRLYPMTRDELVECTALLSAVRAGHLDALEPPTAPLDVLAQQIVAEVAAQGEWSEDALFELVGRAAPFADLDRENFDEVVDLMSWGITTGRGRQGAHLHRDGVNGVLRPRRGARLAALMSGGAIPETGDYRVVLDPEGVTVGSVHEDFAVEANIGDVFLLGTHSWRVKQVAIGTVRVIDAGNAAPTVPFWVGEAPSRTAELSAEVGELRAAIDGAIAAGDGAAARAIVVDRSGVTDAVAQQVVTYLAAGRLALGVLPTATHLVIERCFDESEGTQLIVHSPYGGRINRALGLALRKRFCVSFDFELQAAADDDTVVLSLGPQHSFALSQVPKMLASATVVEVLTQAVLVHPMLAARWRWNCNRALIVPRSRGGQRRPIHLQRMDADDVLAAAWPQLAACQENAPAGPIPLPDHVLVRQTVADCLSEALDADGLVALLGDIEQGRVQVHFVESAEPSPLAHGILTGKPYTFLDGAPLEERRTRAVPLRRGLGVAGPDGLPVAVDELGPLDGPAVADVLEQLRPRPRDPDELHDVLLSLVCCRPVPDWQPLFDVLVDSGRATVVESGWAPTERADLAATLAEDDEAAAECAQGHLDLAGPVSVDELVDAVPLGGGAPLGAPLSTARARTALARLEGRGSAISLPDGRWCARHLLVRLHAASRSRRRRHVEPASITELMRFLVRWQHVAPGTQFEGRSGLLAAIEQLQGIEVPAGDWEAHVLSSRVADYDPRWLDELCLSGEVAWGRLTPRPDTEEPARRGATTPSRATPLALTLREDLGWLLAAVRTTDHLVEPTSGAAADVLGAVRDRGALFRSELPAVTGRLPAEVDEGLWDLVSRGMVTADAFSAVRSLLVARGRWRARQRHGPAGRVGLARRRASLGTGLGEGRWALLPGPPEIEGDAGEAADELAEAVAWQLLTRWGVVAWEVWARESFRVPWREVVRALRRLEARGLALGGRFVAGLAGEQYAAPEAADLLGLVRRTPAEGAELAVAGTDPLNLTGTVLPGPRVPALRHRRVVLRDGVVVSGAEAS